MIEFKNVSKVYDTGTEAVHNANFKINKGEFVFLVGSSGSGKSTLIKLILKEEEPTKLDMFLKAKEAVHDLWEFIADEYSSTDDVSMFSELEQAKNLISDADDILERAELRAEGRIKDQKTTRIVLKTMCEYFTVDPTTSELRYTEIPEGYRK